MDPEPLIYVGPSFRRGGLIPGRIYKPDPERADGLPRVFDKLLIAQPAIQFLFVPASKLGAFKEALKEKGSIEHSYFELVQEWILEQLKKIYATTHKANNENP